jgi:hypothetical protein
VARWSELTGAGVRAILISPYRVLFVVGSGGMGTLYRVADEARDNEVVARKTVKLDIPAMEAPGSVARFQREIVKLWEAS